MSSENVLSVFVDESGDFGEVKERPSYYLVTLVFHDQKHDITHQINKLEDSIKSSGIDIEYIHTGPIIRREAVFNNLSIDDRRKMIFKILNFMKVCPIKCTTVVIDRKTAGNKVQLSGKISKALTEVFMKHDDFFRSFDAINVYYDNGQDELSAVLNAVFSARYENVEFKKAEPQKYRLLQVADFICSIELLRIKMKENRLSSSEKKFFYKPQELKKSFIKPIDMKQL